MSAYYIRDPYILPDQPNSIGFVLTTGDVGAEIAQGTREFIQETLDALGVKAKTTNWSIQRYRSNYYSEYLGEDNWRDIWQIIWKVQVVTTRKIKVLPKRRETAIATDAMDASWSPDDQEEDDPVGCLVISDFESEKDIIKAQEMIIGNELENMRNRYSADTPRFSRADVRAKYKQLQIDLGVFPSEFFAQGADYAEQVVALCKRANGTVHFMDRE